MVNDPFTFRGRDLLHSAIAGKPYTVSEVNNAFPNRYDGEGIPILAAYGGMQDWDGIFWYTFEPKADPAWKPYVGDAFDIFCSIRPRCRNCGGSAVVSARRCREGQQDERTLLLTAAGFR